jgi:hypothetical protein
MSLTKMSLAGNNLLITGSGRVWLDGKIDPFLKCKCPSPVYLPLKSVNSLLLQVKAEWAFKVYDYNEDEKIDGEDIKRVVMDIIGRNRLV